MSHELTVRDDGKVEMAYMGDTPWHRLGTRVSEGTPVREWIGAAGMDWTVEQAPVHFTPAEAEGRIFDDRFVLYRSDNKMPLGVVSGDYCILQPAEVLEFFDDLVQSVGLQLETAGTLFGGKRFWALAKIGEQALIDRQDKIKAYLLLSSSADGLRATEARFTSVRVVGNNTLRMSDTRDSEGQIKISHRTQFVPESIKQRLGVASATFDTFMTNIRRLADTRVSDAKAETLTRTLLGKDDDQKGGQRFAKAMALFRGEAVGFDTPGFEGSAWGWVNSVTEMVDHHGRAKNDSRRLDAILFGPGEKLKAKALGMALELT